MKKLRIISVLLARLPIVFGSRYFIHPFGKRTKLFPGRTMDVITHLEEYYFSRQELMLLIEGDERIKIRIRGEVNYSDGFHSNKVTDYDFRYSRGNWVPQRIDESTDKMPNPETPAESDYKPN